MALPERDFVFVKNISPKSSRDSLLLYMEHVTGADVQEIYYGPCKTEAMVLFEERIKDFSQVIAKAANKKHDGQILELKHIPSCDKIIVKDIKQDQAITEDFLELYFEKPSSGGGEVKNCNLEAEKHRAVVEVEDPLVVPVILAKNHHEKLGKNVQLLPYTEEFLKEEQVTKEEKVTETDLTKGVRVLPARQLSQDDSLPLPSEQVLAPFGAVFKQKIHKAKSMHDITPGSSNKYTVPSQFPDALSRKSDAEEVATHQTAKQLHVEEPSVQKGETPSQPQPKEEEIQRDVKMSKATRELLSKLGFWKDTASTHPLLKTSWKEDGVVQYHGPKSSVTGMLLQTYEKLQEVSEETDPLSESLSKLLRRKEAADIISKALEESLSIAVVWEIVGSALTVTTLGEKNAQHAVSIIGELLHKKCHDVDDYNRPLLKTTTFQNVIEDLHQRHLVVITVRADNRVIVFEGFLKDVNKSFQTVSDYFEKNCIITDSISTDIRGLKYLSLPQISNRIRDSIDMLNRENPAIRVSFNINLSAGKMVLQGPRIAVIKATDMVEKNFIQTLVHLDVQVAQIGITEFLQEGTGSSLLRSVGTDNQCYIELEERAVVRSVSHPHSEHQAAAKLPSRDASENKNPGSKSASRASRGFLARLWLGLGKPSNDGEANAAEVSVEDEPKEASTTPRLEDTSHLMTGNVKITLRKGDITKDRLSSVLVNVVTEKLTLEYGLAKIFGKAGGDEMQEALRAQAPGQFGEVKVTPKSGRLADSCKEVYHIVCQKYKAGHEKTLESMVEACLKAAAKSNHPSIAFPSVGCGGLNYPLPLVAKLMLDVIAKFANGGGAQSSLKYVNIVVYEARTFGAFFEQLKSRMESRSQARGNAESESGSGVESSDDDTDNPHRYVTPPSESSGGSTLTSSKTSTIYICGGSRKEVDCAKRQIEDLIQKHYKEDQIREDIIKDLPKREFEPLLKKAKEMGVGFSIDQKGIAVHVKGDETKVNNFKVEAMSFFNKKIKEYSSGTLKLDRARRSGNPDDYIMALAVSEIIPAPIYWSTTYKDKRGSIILSPTKTQKVFKMVKVDDKTRQAVTDMFQKTWQPHLVGHGRDARGLAGYQSLKVTTIENVENPQLYRKYGDKRREHCQHYVNGTLRPFHTLDTSLTKVSTSTLGITHLDEERLDAINEHFLFHGTKAENVNAICNGGADFRIAKEGGMFGQGIYTAESSSKADQYADPKDQRQMTGLKMFLFRVLLGKVFYCRETKKFKRPPCTGTGCNDSECKVHHDFYDSIIGDAKKLFREFVVYDRAQSYPEFLITYDRV